MSDKEQAAVTQDVENQQRMQKLVEEKDSEEPSEAISYGKERPDEASKHGQSHQVLEAGKEEGVTASAENAQPGDPATE